METEVPLCRGSSHPASIVEIESSCLLAPSLCHSSSYEGCVHFTHGGRSNSVTALIMDAYGMVAEVSEGSLLPVTLGRGIV